MAAPLASRSAERTVGSRAGCLAEKTAVLWGDLTAVRRASYLVERRAGSKGEHLAEWKVALRADLTAEHLDDRWVD